MKVVNKYRRILGRRPQSWGVHPLHNLLPVLQDHKTGSLLRNDTKSCLTDDAVGVVYFILTFQNSISSALPVKARSDLGNSLHSV